jgi:hypothetical protein
MAFRIASGVMALLFLLATAVQYNDPDPLRWMAIYGVAGFFSLQAARGRLASPWGPAIVGLIALGWAVFTGRTVIGRVSLGEVFESVGMKTEPIEVARETLGLLIVTFWMAVLTLRLPAASGQLPTHQDDVARH